MTAADLQSWLHTVAELAAPAINLLTLFLVFRANGDIREVARQTNHIKDQLVSATAKASDLEGEKRGRQAEIDRHEASKGA